MPPLDMTPGYAPAVREWISTHSGSLPFTHLHGRTLWKCHEKYGSEWWASRTPVKRLKSITTLKTTDRKPTLPAPNGRNHTTPSISGPSLVRPFDFWRILPPVNRSLPRHTSRVVTGSTFVPLLVVSNPLRSPVTAVCSFHDRQPLFARTFAVRTSPSEISRVYANCFLFPSGRRGGDPLECFRLFCDPDSRGRRVSRAKTDYRSCGRH